MELDLAPGDSVRWYNHDCERWEVFTIMDFGWYEYLKDHKIKAPRYWTMFRPLVNSFDDYAELDITWDNERRFYSCMKAGDNEWRQL